MKILYSDFEIVDIKKNTPVNSSIQIVKFHKFSPAAALNLHFYIYFLNNLKSNTYFVHNT